MMQEIEGVVFKSNLCMTFKICPFGSSLKGACCAGQTNTSMRQEKVLIFQQDLLSSPEQKTHIFRSMGRVTYSRRESFLTVGWILCTSLSNL